MRSGEGVPFEAAAVMARGSFSGLARLMVHSNVP